MAAGCYKGFIEQRLKNACQGHQCAMLIKAGMPGYISYSYSRNKVKYFSSSSHIYCFQIYDFEHQRSDTYFPFISPYSHTPTTISCYSFFVKNKKKKKATGNNDINKRHDFVTRAWPLSLYHTQKRRRCSGHPSG